MRFPAKRRITAALLLVTIGILVYTSIRAYPYLLEPWKIEQLDSDDPAVRDAAATWLGHHGSVRALPKLMELLRESYPPHQTTRNNTWEPFSPSAVDLALIQLGEPAARAIVEALHRVEVDWMYAPELLYRMEATAYAPLLDCVLNHHDAGCVVSSFRMLFSQDEGARAADSTLFVRAERETGAARRRTLKVLEAIRSMTRRELGDFLHDGEFYKLWDIPTEGDEL
ncbi:MAG: HEAT repeat domain-containing protein [Planctomycetota bacterium]